MHVLLDAYTDFYAHIYTCTSTSMPSSVDIILMSLACQDSPQYDDTCTEVSQAAMNTPSPNAANTERYTHRRERKRGGKTH